LGEHSRPTGGDGVPPRAPLVSIRGNAYSRGTARHGSLVVTTDGRLVFDPSFDRKARWANTFIKPRYPEAIGVSEHRYRDIEWIHVRFRLWFGEFLILRPDPDPSSRVLFGFELQRRAILRDALLRTGYTIDKKTMTNSQFAKIFPR
jgi:hypothetical protein